MKPQIPESAAIELAGFFGNLKLQTEATASVEDVKTTTNEIISKFEDALGLDFGERTKLDGGVYVDRIKELLDKSLVEYKERNIQEAKSFAIETYVDNYENIESDIAQENKELMEKIEMDLNVMLRQMIDEGRPGAEIESHIDGIKTDLETARTVVTPEFPLAAIVLITVAGVILVGALYKAQSRTGRL